MELGTPTTEKNKYTLCQDIPTYTNGVISITLIYLTMLQ